MLKVSECIEFNAPADTMSHFGGGGVLLSAQSVYQLSVKWFKVLRIMSSRYSSQHVWVMFMSWVAAANPCCNSRFSQVYPQLGFKPATIA